MITLTTGTETHIRITLSERVTFQSPYYLFRFVQRTTNQEIKFVKSSTEDLSSFPDRYNEFVVDVDQLFCGMIGEYQYYIYEQYSASCTDLEATGALLEQGLARLNAPSEDTFSFKAFTQENIYITP